MSWFFMELAVLSVVVVGGGSVGVGAVLVIVVVVGVSLLLFFRGLFVSCFTLFSCLFRSSYLTFISSFAAVVILLLLSMCDTYVCVCVCCW